MKLRKLNKDIFIDGYLVALTNILTTPCFTLKVYQQESDYRKDYFKGGSYYSHDNGIKYRQVGRDPDPQLYDRLPVGLERTYNLNIATSNRQDIALKILFTVYPAFVRHLNENGLKIFTVLVIDKCELSIYVEEYSHPSEKEEWQ